MNDEKLSSPAVPDSGVIDHKTTWRSELVFERNPKATRRAMPVQRARRAPLVVFLSLLIPGGAS